MMIPVCLVLAIFNKVYLNSNQLSGALPYNIFINECIECMCLSDNNLRGTIPAYLAPNTKL